MFSIKGFLPLKFQKTLSAVAYQQLAENYMNIAKYCSLFIKKKLLIRAFECAKIGFDLTEDQNEFPKEMFLSLSLSLMVAELGLRLDRPDREWEWFLKHTELNIDNVPNAQQWALLANNIAKIYTIASEPDIAARWNVDASSKLGYV